MADETRNAEVRLTAQVDPYVSSVQQASEETAKFSAVVDQLTNKFDKLQKVAGKKLVIFGAGVGVGVVGVTKQAADLEKRMSTLHATAAVTTKTTAGFEKEINKLGKQLPITNKAAIELVTTLDKLGVNSTRRIGDISREMVKLSEATGESLGGLTNGMVGLGRQMGTLAAGDMSTFANSLLRVSKSAGVSAEGVLSFSQAIAGSARAAGMTEQQVLGIGAAFQRAGADGFAAANTFNQMLNAIQRQPADRHRVAGDREVRQPHRGHQRAVREDGQGRGPDPDLRADQQAGPGRHQGDGPARLRWRQRRALPASPPD